MKCLEEWRRCPEDVERKSELFNLDPSHSHIAGGYHIDTYNAKKIVNHLHSQEQPQTDCSSPSQSQNAGFGWRSIRILERSIMGKRMFKPLELYFNRGITLAMFSQFAKNCHQVTSTRDWFAQLRFEEGFQNVDKKETALKNCLLLFSFSSKWLGSWKMVERFNDFEKPFVKQLPPSQTSVNILQPTSPEDTKIQALLTRADLQITRGIKWANLMLGFEQENHYAILDPCYPQSPPLGFIHEQSNIVLRQLFPTNRPFIANITDVMGNEIFKVRRPIWFANSTTYTEINGKNIGMIRRRWHPWRRVYDLYLGKQQFAVADNPGLWNWTFTLKDKENNLLAKIDRKWRGILFELFTDAGQYVVQFGNADPNSKTGSALATQELEVSRPLTISERAVTLALALSLDYDHFSGVPDRKNLNEVLLKKGFRSCFMDKLI